MGWGHPAKGATTPPKADNIDELTRAFTEESGQNSKAASSWHVSPSEASLDGDPHYDQQGLPQLPSLIQQIYIKHGINMLKLGVQKQTKADKGPTLMELTY